MDRPSTPGEPVYARPSPDEVKRQMERSTGPRVLRRWCFVTIADNAQDAQHRANAFLRRIGDTPGAILTEPVSFAPVPLAILDADTGVKALDVGVLVSVQYDAVEDVPS